jgi:hypothetical protein
VAISARGGGVEWVAVSEGEGASRRRRLIYRGSVGEMKGRGGPGGSGAWRGHG